MPPSTSMRKPSRRDSRIFDSNSIFFREEWIKVWPPKPGVHAHDQDMMNQRKNLIESMDRCGRVYNYSGLASVRCDQMKGAIEMDAGFLVDGDPISAGFGKCGYELVRPFNS